MYSASTSRFRHMRLFSPANRARIVLPLLLCTTMGSLCPKGEIGVVDPLSFTLSPATLSLTVGDAGTFTAQISGGPSTRPSLTSCTSDAAAVATVSAQGNACRVVAVGAGNATITARLSSGAAAGAQVMVIALPDALTGLTVNPLTAALVVNQTLALDARAVPRDARVSLTYSYVSLAPAIATVDGSGVVRGVAPGNTDIRVTATGRGSGSSEKSLTEIVRISVTARAAGLTDLVVGISPNIQPLLRGDTRQIAATAVGPSAPVSTLRYGPSSAPTVASVSATGLITAVAPGSTSIDVVASVGEVGTFGASSITKSIVINVAAGQAPFTNFALTPTSPSPLVIGTDLRVTASYSQVITATVAVVFSSNRPDIASITSAGIVTAQSPGTAVITATATGSGPSLADLTESKSITVTVRDRTPGVLTLGVSPTSANLIAGQFVTLVPTVTGPTSSQVSYTFQSDQPLVATVSAIGVVTAVSPGPALIRVIATAPQSGAFSATTLTTTTTVTVRSGVRSIMVSPSTLSLRTAQAIAISATVVAETGASTAVQFISRNPAIATVASAGLVTGVSVGTVSIIARAVADTTVMDSVLVAVVSACDSRPLVTLGNTVSGQVDLTSCSANRELYRFNLATQSRVRFSVAQSNSIVSINPLVASTGGWSVSLNAGGSVNALAPVGAWTFFIRSAAIPNQFQVTTAQNPVDDCALLITTTGIANASVAFNSTCSTRVVGGVTYSTRKFYFVPQLNASETITLRASAPFQAHIDLYGSDDVLLSSAVAPNAGGQAVLTYTATSVQYVYAEIGNRPQPTGFGALTVSFTGPPLISGLRFQDFPALNIRR